MAGSNEERERALVDGMTMMQVIAEAAVGYRRKLLEGGCSEALADAMTAEWHTAMMEVMKNAALAKTSTGGPKYR